MLQRLPTAKSMNWGGNVSHEPHSSFTLPFTACITSDLIGQCFTHLNSMEIQEDQILPSFTTRKLFQVFFYNPEGKLLQTVTTVLPLLTITK